MLDSAHDCFIDGFRRPDRVVERAGGPTFGWSRDEVIGRQLSDTIIPVGFRPAHIEGLRRFHHTGEAPIVNRRLELRGLHRDGHEFPIEITVTTPVRAGRLLLRRVRARHLRTTAARRRAAQAKESGKPRPAPRANSSRT